MRSRGIFDRPIEHPAPEVGIRIANPRGIFAALRESFGLGQEIADRDVARPLIDFIVEGVGRGLRQFLVETQIAFVDGDADEDRQHALRHGIDRRPRVRADVLAVIFEDRAIASRDHDRPDGRIGLLKERRVIFERQRLCLLGEWRVLLAEAVAGSPRRD
jgi:hypothetical protein